MRRTLEALVERVDEWQQRRRRLAVLVAVGKRYHEDRGRRSGALLSYYGFMSLFPLLLVAATILGIALQDSPTLRDEILDTVYARIPVIGDQLRVTPPTLEVNSAAAVVGLVVSLWSGLGVIRVAEDALHLQWGVPRFQRPGYVRRQLRALAALAVVGLGIIAATLATNLGAFLPDLPVGERVVAAALAIAVNVAVLLVGFRILIETSVAWRDLLPGSVVGGAALWLLQLLGGTYVSRVIIDATDVFGVFATTFGLLVWIALLARTVLLANEVNVVRAKALWPRGLRPSHPTEADRRAAEETMRREALIDLT